MNQTRLEPLAPLTGAAAAVLVVVSALILNFWTYLPSGAELQDYYTSNSGRVMAGGYIGAVAAFALMWFAGSVRDRMSRHDGPDGRLGALAFGGTLAAGALLAAGYAVVVAAGARGGDSLGIGEGTAVALYDLYGNLIVTGVGAALAVMLVAVGLVIFRRGGLPKWVGWVSVILAIGSISPLAFVFVGFDVVWIATASIWMYADQQRAAA